MSLSLRHSEFLLSPPPLHRRTIPSRPNYRSRKRRRLKSLTVQSMLNPTPPPFGELLSSFLSHLPSANSLSYLAPTLGLALLFSFRSSKSAPNPNPTGNFDTDVGEWILFTSPTPFNRFVTLRCPSIYFPGNEFLGDVNERLVKEDKHYVKLNCGRMIHMVKSDWDGDGNMVYQRVCVTAEDGGVLALDFPADLDLEEERGLDNTVLIVPGTPEGSNERMIRVFVCDCLRRGIFPVVMNPRGCAGSPLITPRLFTAADSDDISTSVQYINKKRPWTTLMGVGWGYGANMLTKYLSELGERTPLTAATCIDNPFDLEEGMRSTVYHTDLDQRHTDGLIEILQRNKEIFQGRGKGYDIEKALSATSTQEFESAISMVSYGFDTIEDFYEKSSTRDVVGRVKVPILFIQNDDGRVPLFSIPRSAIAKNPYTSLLLCSYSPSSKIMDDTLTWCQSLTLEWLTAVELGLLKGRHPLLEDTDVTINPSKGSELVEGRDSSKRTRADMVLDITDGNSTNPPLNMLHATDTATANQSQSVKDVGAPAFSTKGLQQVDNKLGRQSSAAVDAVVDEVANDDERGQVLQTTQVVMNMVDMTMPDTLSDEQKKKVLNAVGRGETVIKALQDAVPEDVRGKLTTAVSGILQDRGSNLKLDKFINLGQIPDMGSGSNSVDQKKTIGDPGDGSDKADHISDKSPGVMDLENQSSEIAQRSNDTETSNIGHDSPDSERENMAIDDPGDGSDKPDNISESSSGVMELEKHSSEIAQRPNDTDTSNLGSNSPDSEMANMNDAKRSSEDEHLSGVGTSQSSDKEIEPEINGNQKNSIVVEGSGGDDGIISDQNNVEREIHNGELDMMEENNKQTNDLSNDDQNKMSETSHAEVESSDPSPTSDAQVIENEAESSQVKEENDPVSNSSQDTGDSPQFNVSQALNAFTGFDDSTQVAVNSVFNVIEGMIDQLEVKEHENEVKNENNKSEANGVDELEVKEHGNEVKTENNKSEVNGVEDLEVKEHENEVKNENNKSEASGVDGVKEKHNEQGENSSNSSDTKRQLGAENEISMVPASGKIPAGDSLKCLSSSSENNKNIFIISSEDPLYREYLKTYLYLKTRNDKPPDMYKKSASNRLGYISEGQCKVLEQIEANNASVDGHAIHVGSFREDQTKTQPISNDTDNIVEPSYVILDSDESQDQIDALHDKELEEMVIVNDNTEFEDSKVFVKNLILKCLNNEVGRRSSVSDIEELEPKLAVEIEFVADAVSMATGPAKLYMSSGSDNQSEEHGSLDGEIIIKAISSAFQDTQYLRRALPVGVVVGSSLAELKKFFNVSTLIGNDEKHLALDQVDSSTESLVQTGKQIKGEGLLRRTENEGDSSGLTSEEPDIIDLEVETSNNNGVMVGALTAALGASALLAHQSNTGTDGTLNEPMKENENGKASSNLDEMPDKAQNNMVTSLAEKAMSVAGPMVPMKEDGGVDQERLVSMLTELGQKGGLLRLVGKVALLWGGIRGAMSLTDKLMSFLRVSERPLFQRIPGFVFLVLLLWSPVVLPFLPSLMQSWATNQPFQIAEFACIAGLYVSVMIMVTSWGKKVRQYEDPILQYGLDLDSLPKFQNFLKGLVGGVAVVVLIHAVNSSFGCANLSWPTTLSSSSSEPVALVKSFGRMLMLILQGIVTATGISLVEESVFRSWLPQEIAADFGHYPGIIVSGLLFALFQRSAWEIPGLWLLSISLSGARQRSTGNLSLPIGIRAGILAANFILKSGNFLTYRRNVPLWVTGGHQFQPFSGVVGFAFSLLLVVILYPRQTEYGKETSRVISESKTSDLEFQTN